MAHAVTPRLDTPMTTIGRIEDGERRTCLETVPCSPHSTEQKRDHWEFVEIIQVDTAGVRIVEPFPASDRLFRVHPSKVEMSHPSENQS